MRAAVIHAHGEAPRPQDFGAPRPRDGAEAVEVVLGGLNPVDLRIASGTFYGGSPDLPYIPGGEGVARLADGTLAYFASALDGFGSFAERALVAPESLVALPPGTDPGLAVACGTAGLTAWLALEHRARVRPGESVLVLGASGVLGTVAAQAARVLEAGPVVVAGRNAAALAGLGADASVTLGAHRWQDELRDAAGRGFDVVIDPLWGAPARAAVEAMAPGGRLVQIGQSAGAEATLASAAIRSRGLGILGLTLYAVPAEIRRDAYLRLLGHAVAGEIRVEVERVPLAAIADAWERQSRSPGHKLAIEP